MTAVTAKTAWLLRRKLTHAMARRRGELLLRGLVELDEGFLGGRRARPASRGRRQRDKAMVAVSAEHTPGGGLGRAHLLLVDDGSSSSLDVAASAMIAHGSIVQTDAGEAMRASPTKATNTADEPCAAPLRSMSGCPGRTSCSRTSSAGCWTSSVACSIAASSTPPRRPARCSRRPE